jgi:dTDP-glucose 4,6-dehydratase
MGTLLVTGGAGFIGSNLAREVLARTTHRLVIVDKLTYAGSLLSLESVLQDPRAEFVRADIADREAMRRVFDEARPDGVVNLAAESHVDRSIDSPHPFIDTNIVGTFVLLDTARHWLDRRAAGGRDSFRFLHVSTDEVYGSLGPEGRFNEHTAYAPSSPYAASKAAADHLARAYFHTYGLPVLLTNCSNNFGPYQFPEKLVPLMVLNALDGRRLPIYGDGGNVRDWLFVDDHCTGLLAVLERGRPGGQYNIGAGNERTNLEVVDRICDTLEEFHPAGANSALASSGVSAYRHLKTFVPDRPGHDRRYAIDATRIRHELGWAPEHGFEEGLKTTVRWYVEHRDWCEAVQGGRYNRERLGLAGAPQIEDRR